MLYSIRKLSDGLWRVSKFDADFTYLAEYQLELKGKANILECGCSGYERSKRAWFKHRKEAPTCKHVRLYRMVFRDNSEKIGTGWFFDVDKWKWVPPIGERP